MAVDADVFRSDESSEVPISSHVAALFASRVTSSGPKITFQRRPDSTGLDRMTETSYSPRAGRFERDFAFSAPRRHADAVDKRRRTARTSPEPERLSTARRFAVAEHLAPSAPPPRSPDIEEFQHGPFHATLERLERQERQDERIMRLRQAESDRLRSRLDELQRHTIINSLPTGTFKEWRNTESDHRCPICLDDVSVPVTPGLPTI
jgi:hypothetical protein